MDARELLIEAKDEAAFVHANLGKVGLVLTVVFVLGLLTGLVI